MSADPEPLMTKDQVAKYLGYSRRWVENQVRDHDMPYLRPAGPGGALRFRKSEVDAWSEDRTGRDREDDRPNR